MPNPDDRVLIFDTTLRDGEQAPGCSMAPAEKLALAGELAALGVDVIEAGFPAASEGDFAAVRAIASGLRSPRVAALARARRDDIARAWEALRPAARPRLHLFLATSDLHLAAKLRLTREQALAQAAEAVAFARGLCPEIEFSAEDATRSDERFLLAVLQTAAAAGATTLNLPDTVGYTTPTEYAALLAAARAALPGVTLSVHCHNDLGLAVANSLAGLEAGARQVECTLNGIGERAGNAALEEIVMALRVRQSRYGLATGIVTERLYSASHLLSRLIGVEVQPNKAIVGRNAFAHEAGIHQHGMLRDPRCYEIMTPQSVGVPESRLVLGKHSGRHALAQRYAELGCALSDADLNSAYRGFLALADRKKKVYDQDLLVLAAASSGGRGGEGRNARL